MVFEKMFLGKIEKISLEKCYQIMFWKNVIG